jgi:hypothetical protein
VKLGAGQSSKFAKEGSAAEEKTESKNFEKREDKQANMPAKNAGNSKVKLGTSNLGAGEVPGSLKAR